MSERRLTDARISTALHSHVPANAPAGLSGRIAVGIAETGQDRSRRFVPRWVDPVDPLDRSRILWMAAALLLAAALGVGLVAGAWRLLHREPPLPAEVTSPLDLSTPQAVRALVHSTYDRMPALPPMTITTMRDGTLEGVIRVSNAGAVRVDDGETSQSAVDHDRYRIYSGTTLGRLTIVAAEPVWVQQADAISEDPRVFVLAELQGSAGLARPGCSSASPDETEASGPAGSTDPGWVVIGREVRLGRDAYHLACGDGDLWIDAQTRLILRSEGPKFGADFQPIPGSRTVIEVTSLDFGTPDGGFFSLGAPDGVRVMTPEAYQCVTQPDLCATPEPETPAPPRIVDRGTMPRSTPTGAANGWIAYSTDPAVVSVSPDGYIAADGPATTGSDLYLVREGGDPILVADRSGGTTWNACPAFSPNGRRLAFGVTRGSERAMVVLEIGDAGVAGEPLRIAVPGSGPLAAPGSDTIACPQWSSDSLRVGYLDGSTVRMYGMDGSPMTHATGDPIAADFTPASSDATETRILSPSGDRTVRLDYADDCQLVFATPDEANVMVLRLGAGVGERHVEPLIGCPYAVAGWSPDGRSVLIMQDISGRDFTMYAVSVEEPYTLTTVVSRVRTNGGRSWAGYGDVSWQPVVD